MARPAAYPMTFEEFDARYSGKRYEYVDGCAVPRAPETTLENGEVDVQPKTPAQQMLALRVGYLVGKHVLDHRLGVPLPNGVGFFMTQDPPELRECDFAFLTPENAIRCTLGEYLPFPPDFAVEIVTEWDSEDYVRRKAASYLANGTRLLWVMYPAAQRVDVYHTSADSRTYSLSENLDTADLFPTLELPVSAIFAPVKDVTRDPLQS